MKNENGVYKVTKITQLEKVTVEKLRIENKRVM